MESRGNTHRVVGTKTNHSAHARTETGCDLVTWWRLHVEISASKMHPRATKVDVKQNVGCLGCHNPGGFSSPSPALPTVTALKVLIRRCGRPIRLHLDRIGCAFRRCVLGCGPSPSSPATGNARGGPNKRRCRRRRAARLHSHCRPGHDGTNTCETRCGSGGASGASRAAPAVCAVLEPAASQNYVSSALAARGGSPNVVALRWYNAKAR